MPQVDWATIAAMCSVFLVGGSITLVLLRSQLSNYFVTRPEHTKIQERVTSVEEKLALLPSHADFREMRAGLAVVGGDLKALMERTDGIRELNSRMDRQLNMLVDAQLQRERSGGS